MYAMQYTINLPTDYDMQIIRDRVTHTGHVFDGFPGLEFKAYLIQEKSHGACRNAYAPFYLWRTINGMRAFCWGEPGYSAIVRDFGRHPIQDWTAVGLTRGPQPYEKGRSLTITTRQLPDGEAPSACLGQIIDPFLAETGADVVARVAAIDITTWTVILVELSTHEPDQARRDSTAYEVLHISAAAPVDAADPS